MTSVFASIATIPSSIPSRIASIRWPDASTTFSGRPSRPRLLTVGGCRLSDEPVADADDRLDVEVEVELFADSADVHVERARLAVVVEPPDSVEQVIAREHAPARLREQPEQRELLSREPYLVAAHADDEVVV